MNNWKRLEGFSVEIIASKDKKFTQKFKISYYLLPQLWRRFRKLAEISSDIFRSRIQRRFGLWMRVKGVRTYSSTILEGLKFEPELLLLQPISAAHPEPNGGWRAREQSSSQESSYHYRAERGNKAGSWEITALHKPSAWFASVISLSALVDQHDRLFGLGAVSQPILVFINRRIH